MYDKVCVEFWLISWRLDTTCCSSAPGRRVGPFGQTESEGTCSRWLPFRSWGAVRSADCAGNSSNSKPAVRKPNVLGSGTAVEELADRQRVPSNPEFVE